MTISAIVGGEKWTEFATSKGYSDFLRWVEGLDEEAFPGLVHLADWGWLNDLEELEAELEAAIDGEVETPNAVKSCLKALLKAVRGRRKHDLTILLTDGLGPG